MQPGVPIDEVKAPAHEFFARAKARLNLEVPAALNDPAIKAQINVPDTIGNTPLHDAVRAYRADTTRLLLAAGADGSPSRADSPRPNPLCFSDIQNPWFLRQINGDDGVTMLKFAFR